MLLIRYTEESFVEPILNSAIKCPVHLYSGEEAIATGICANLNDKDFIFGNHRSHGHYLAKGGSLEEMIAEIYCRETGCCKGRGGSMHLINPEKGIMGVAPIVAGTISLATGAALASKIKKNDSVTVSFFGDGAAGEGVLYESMNFASLKKLPIIFLCENNFYSTHLHISETRANKNIFEIAKPFDIDTYQVDGNDVLAVYEIGKKAVKSCRNGNGPVFIECITYRLRGHVGPDDNVQGSHTDIRPKKEILEWIEKDPIKRFEKYLLQNNLISGQEAKQINADIIQRIEEITKEVLKTNKPNGEDLIKYVFK